jgi:hypothetical protein
MGGLRVLCAVWEIFGCRVWLFIGVARVKVVGEEVVTCELEMTLERAG